MPLTPEGIDRLRAAAREVNRMLLTPWELGFYLFGRMGSLADRIENGEEVTEREIDWVEVRLTDFRQLCPGHPVSLLLLL